MVYIFIKSWDEASFWQTKQYQCVGYRNIWTDLFWIIPVLQKLANKSPAHIKSQGKHFFHLFFEIEINRHNKIYKLRTEKKNEFMVHFSISSKPFNRYALELKVPRYCCRSIHFQPCLYYSLLCFHIHFPSLCLPFASINCQRFLHYTILLVSLSHPPFVAPNLCSISSFMAYKLWKCACNISSKWGCAQNIVFAK